MRTFEQTIRYELYTIDELQGEARQIAMDNVNEYILKSRDTWEFNTMVEDYFHNTLDIPRVNYSYQLDHVQGDHFQIATRLDFSDIFRLADLLHITLGYLSLKEKRTLEFYSNEGCTVDVRVSEYNRYNAAQDWDPCDIWGPIVDNLEQHYIRDIEYDLLKTFSYMAMGVGEEIERNCMEWGYQYFDEIDDDEVLDIIQCDNIEFLEDGTIF